MNVRVPAQRREPNERQRGRKHVRKNFSGREKFSAREKNIQQKNYRGEQKNSYRPVTQDGDISLNRAERRDLPACVSQIVADSRVRGRLNESV